jgi:hypothetical protein
MRLAITALLILLFLPAAAQLFADTRSGLVQKVTGGEIDWENQSVLATAEALMPSKAEEPNRTKAHLKAKGSARTKAIANLLVAIDALPVNYAICCQDLMKNDDLLRQAIEGLAHNAEIVSDRRVQQAGESMVEVTTSIPLYGAFGPGRSMLRSLVQQEKQGRASAQVKVETPKPFITADAPSNQKGPFSSLIIDARGFRLQKALNPRIRKPDGVEVWGSLQLDMPVLPSGVAVYMSSVDDAQQHPYSGKNPLIIRAVGRAGGAIFCDAVITTTDADLILKENKTSQFLDDFRVFFIVDAVSE